MWPEESSSPDANKYLGVLYFCLILIPSWCILFVFLYRRHLQPIKGRLPMLSFLAQLCGIAHETYLCFQLLYGDQIPCGLVVLLPYITILPAVDFYLARGYILYFVFHVTQERLALASEKLAHERERATSQSQSQIGLGLPSSEKDWETTQNDSSFLSRESTLKWFLRNRYRIQRPFLSACLVTLLFLQMIYPVIYAVSAGDQRGISRDQSCGGSSSNLVLGIEIALLIVVAIWIAVKLRHIHDAFALKDELRLVSAIAFVGVVVWIILTNVESIRQFCVSVFDLTTLYLFFVEEAVFILTIVIPLYHSFDPIMQWNHDDDQNDAQNLKQIIDMVPGFESFRAFLTREFSVQNLLFYVDVRDFCAKYDPNGVDANSQTKSHPTSPIVTPTATTAPPSPSLAPVRASPHSTPRGASILRAASMIATNTTTATTSTTTNAAGAGAAAARASASSGASASPPRSPSQPRSSSTICTATSAILSTLPFGRKEKEKEKEKEGHTPQQLAEHNKRILLTQANLEYEASRLFRKYVAFGAPLQVNLSDTIVTSLAQALGLNRDGSRAHKKVKRERETHRTSSFLSSANTFTPSKHHSVSTAPMPRPRHDDIELNSIDITMEQAPINHAMFNEAQTMILRLMAVDSFKRYKKSSDYQDLSKVIESDPLMKLGLGRL